MSRSIGIGIQDFGKIRRDNGFYIDKTDFIKEWWEKRDDVTLITRPRRFGKTLNMSMMDYFFSTEHAKDKKLFEGLKIFEEEKYRELQGTYPVIFISFAGIKESSYDKMYDAICTILYNTLQRYRYLISDDPVASNRKMYDKTLDILFQAKDSALVPRALKLLSELLAVHYGKNVIILMDEYDTPMQEAYLGGCWDEAVSFFRIMMNATFKDNPYVEKALITGITRVSKESMFSDLNNLEVVTTTSQKYTTAFGFTEEEVFAAMDEFGMTSKDEMKRWYDGFTFGNTTDIYNPWSVINALDKREYKPYWVNTSSNGLLNRLMKQGSANLKMQVEELLKGNSITCRTDEEIVYKQLDTSPDAVWSLMLASGYLKVVKVEQVGRFNESVYTLRLLNLEVEMMMHNMVRDWFAMDQMNYNGFIQALLENNEVRMNQFINRVSLNMFSYFDAGNHPSVESEPERFYRGFVLGLMVDLEERYVIKSNRESGFGRYDVMMIPKDKKDKAFLFEFKVKDACDHETTLEDTLQNALKQIEEKQYAQELIASGIPADHIRKYGFAFEGKTVLIGAGEELIP